MRKKIIVVDDDRDILDVITLILEENEFEVYPVGDILSFYKIGDINPDLVLLDDWLTDGYGSNLCLTLKGDPITQNIPVILISAKNNVADVAAACRADGFISKPFDIDVLVDTVKRFMR